ncbi:glycosyltransferase family 2 protein [Solidesulfovibrio magneticus]|uniref:Glycosyltransferase n=1 Tax=Solidesulfovibrio magneticus (strain ATCC 700980 / DSM 13731 / RS-1) TaxID=573370 RepID=C4XUJ1_SOLM1|nr:glycosyltransferase family 2 protein [Solidesulfovibrio magneticus]BAH73442.1 glycosyltransferase [Solidesulfovibrio magneticus RS-1]
MITKRPTLPYVSVVLSFYNEECVLPELLRRLRAVFREEIARESVRGYELIFVDDASTDNSAAVLNEEYRIHDDVVIVTMSRNFGVSECVLAGMEQAKGELVVYMDADLQDPPEVIPRLLDAWHADPEVEVVYTTRRSRAGEHPLKLLITKWGYRLINSISSIALPVDSGDFKLLSRRVVDELLHLGEVKPYLRALVSWVGFKQIPVYYDREPRLDGAAKTKCPVLSRKVIWGYFDRALISFSDAPLKLCLFLGFSVSFMALLYILVVLVQKVLGWYVPGWPALMAAILLIGGVQLLMIGFIGLYINIIYLESRRRPRYIINRVDAKDNRAKPTDHGRRRRDIA